jgi:hypothetical protein
MCIHICMHICVYICVCTYVHMCIHMCLHICTYVYTYMYAHTYICVYIYVCTYVYGKKCEQAGRIFALLAIVSLVHFVSNYRSSQKILGHLFFESCVFYFAKKRARLNFGWWWSSSPPIPPKNSISRVRISPGCKVLGLYLYITALCQNLISIVLMCVLQKN